MNINQEGLDFIEAMEGGLKTSAYLDSANIPTIGIGCIFMSPTIRVKMGDTITLEQGQQMFQKEIVNVVSCANNSIKSILEQNKFNAIISFIYNVGCYNFQTSTLLKKINVNPNDPTIFQEFQKWDKEMVNGQMEVSQGLLNRRNKEIALWFNNKVPNLIS